MSPIHHVIQGLYGISESEKMIPNKSTRLTLHQTVECLEKALELYEQELKEKIIDDFAYTLYNESTNLKLESDDYGILNYEDIYNIAKQMKENKQNCDKNLINDEDIELE